MSAVRDGFDPAASRTSLAYGDLLRQAALPVGREPQGGAAIEQVLVRLLDSSLHGSSGGGYRG